MIRVFAPATSANLNVGFDKLGVALRPLSGALGDEILINEAEADYLSVSGPYAEEIKGPNIVARALERVRELTGLTSKASIELRKCMPVGSGLGSSAASVVAAVIACDEFYGRRLGADARLALMGELEAVLSGGIHWDNILPCALGGLRLGASRLPAPPGWIWLVAYPGIRLETRAMRTVLPASVALGEAVDHAARLGLFVDALHRGAGREAARLMVDPIVEPRRSPLIPGFDAVKHSLLEAGAIAAGISGSGPTVFALFDDASAAESALAAAGAWASGVSIAANGNDTGSFARLCAIDETGATIVGTTTEE